MERPDTLTPLYIFVGTYEKVLFGFTTDLAKTAPKDKKILVPIFTVTSHLEPIKSVACHGQFLVSGSQDETVIVYNIRKRIEVGTLQHHSGAVSCAGFVPGFMLSGGSDGKLVMWKCNGWEPLLTLKAHKSGVRALAVLSNGKAALTLGADKKVKLWDLVKGKSGFSVSISSDSDALAWAPSGEVFCVNSPNSADLYRDGKLEKELTHPQAVLCMCYVDENTLATGCEDGKVRKWDTRTGELLRTFEGHTARVKAVVSVQCDSAVYLISAASDGTVHLWHNDLDKPLGTVETNSRVTCLSAMMDIPELPIKRQKDDHRSESSSKDKKKTKTNQKHVKSASKKQKK